MKQRNYTCYLILLFMLASRFLGAQSSPSKKTGVEISERHIIIVEADQDRISASYYLGVMNHGEKPMKFSTPILFPKQMTHFEPQGSLTNDDIHLKSNGQIFLEKEFPKGLTLANLGFQVELKTLPEKILSFTAPYDLKELSIVTSKSSPLQFTGEGFEPGVPHMLANSEYKGIMVHNKKKDQAFRITIQGFPEHGKNTWLLGSLFLSLLLSLGSFLTLRTSPKRKL